MMKKIKRAMEKERKTHPVVNNSILETSVIPWQVLNYFVDFTYLSKEHELQVGKDKKTYNLI